MRKQYIDHIRTITILLLFPYHTFMIYNDWGEAFYINGAPLLLPSLVIRISSVWMMPLLFCVAGISSAYALEKRRASAYMKERFFKLLVPLIFGLILIIPIQSYLASLYHHAEGASYLHFFTRLHDFSGVDGAFTTGQLWFILYLFVLSILFLPIMLLYNTHSKKTLLAQTPLAVLALLGLIPVFAHPLLDIGGKSLGEFGAYFLLGYFILSRERILQKLEKFRFLLFGLSVAATGVSIYFGNAFFEEASWLAVLAILGFARYHLNFSNKASAYLSKASYGIYLFHQSWIVVIAFFIFKFTNHPAMQIPMILIISIVLTFATHEICKRIPPARWMFGLKK